MRFFIDHNVGTAVATALRRRRHQVWTAAEAELDKDSDENLSGYADTKGAALITHDREFTRHRRNEPLGQHVRLDCRESEAAAVLVRHLPALLAILNGRNPVTVVITRDNGPRILEPDHRPRRS